MIISNKGLINHLKWNKKVHYEVSEVQEIHSSYMLYLTWTIQLVKSRKQSKKQEQVRFNQDSTHKGVGNSTHKGVGTVQTKPNPLKHRHEVTVPLLSLHHKFQDRFGKVFAPTFWSVYEEYYLWTSPDIHLTFIGWTHKHIWHSSIWT